MDEAGRLLKEIFGFDRFRSGQEQVISTLLQGRSAMAIFPTGGGKSLCYQLPALMLDGLTVVVSPLIALMKDQVEFLLSRGVPAARLDSSLESSEARYVYERVRSGRLKILYVAPERLTNERFRAMVGGHSVSLLAVDEAHCISEWGHNFRPEYLRLADVADELSVGRVLALTATATPEVAADVAAAFGIARPDVIRTPFHRPNLQLHATPCQADERPRLLLSRLQSRPPGPAIVYVTLQRTAEEIARFLGAHGVDAEAYHAGLADDVRHQVQDRFMASEHMVVVATIAFGMGIDKANLRAVYHFNLPKGPENYAQEIGRAGRDGLPAVCELFASSRDVVVLENFAYGDTPTSDAVEAIVRKVLDQPESFSVSIHELSNAFDVRPLVVQTLLTYLELEGALLATGPLHAEARIQLHRPADQIASRFKGERASFVTELLSQGKMGKVWRTISLETACQAMNQPRERLMKALHYLEEQGELTLQLSGVRQGYRRIPTSLDPAPLAAILSDRFLAREQREVDRIGRMLAFASEPGCLTRRLLRHFGEDLAGDCGHCGPCLGQPFVPLPDEDAPAISGEVLSQARRLASESSGALGSPRQLARFLCGLGSPATSKARLTRHPLFGVLAGVPFARVLHKLEGR